jgi:hypothetical protein
MGNLSGIPSRARRIEAFWNRITLVVGCAAIVAIVGSVVVVITKQAIRTPEVEADSFTGELTSWSGRTDSPDALMDAFTAQMVESRKVARAAQDAKKLLSQMANGAAPATSVKPTDSVSLNEVIAQPPVAMGIDDIDAKRERISQRLSAFFEAPTLEAKLALIRDPQRVKPLMVSYYAREPMPTWKFRGLGRAVRVAEPGYRFGYVQALFEDASPATLIVEETPTGEFLLDWECMVRYGELSWTDFLRMRPEEPKLLRLIASKPSTITPPGAEGSPTAQWIELRHPAESGTVLGYFDRNDPKYAQLLEQLQQGQWKDVPVTLRLCYPSGPTSLMTEGVRIADVEGKGWLILGVKTSS